MYFIGMKGTGCDIEFKVVKETAKAYLVKDELNNEVWLPKSAFEDNGVLSDWGKKLYQEKLTGE
jgi:hypothetical protein